MESQSLHPRNSLSASGVDYLEDIGNDFGGAKAAKLGQEAATRYLRNTERGGVASSRFLRLMAALSATALVVSGYFVKDSSDHPAPTEGVGCLITVTEENGIKGAWGIASDVAPEGRLGEVYGVLANQQKKLGGELSAGDVVLIPDSACDKPDVESISSLLQQPVE